MPIGLGLATLIGAGLSFVGGLFSNAVNHKTAQENIDFQKDVNAQNIAFQKEENEITRAREDTAVQRAAEDMTAAGLSKTLAAGNPASAAALQAPQTQAPNNSFKYESALQKMNIAQLLQSMAEKEKQLDMADKKNEAEINFINKQAEGLDFDNKHKLENFQADMAIKNAQAFQFRTQGELNRNNAMIAGITSNYVAKRIESEIDLNIMSKIQKQADVTMTAKQIKAMSYDIAMKVMQTKGLYLENRKKKQELKMLIYDQAKVKFEIEGLKHNLNYAQKYNYPVGSMPGGRLGGAYSIGLSIGGQFKNGPSYSPSTGEFMYNWNGESLPASEIVRRLNEINGYNY